MKCAVAIFAKTIGLSAVKTRLAASIGQEKAEAFYRLSVACIEDVMKDVSLKNSNVFPHWVLAEEDGVTHSNWNRFPAMWTGEGGLGDRLANISHRFLKTHDVVFLVGTDSPQMSSEDILEAVRKLETNSEINHIAGPAKDGGFWLWGSRKALPLELWQSVAYSVETTLDELIKRTNEQGDEVSIVNMLQDVDVLQDLVSLQKSLENQGDKLLPTQKNLLVWLQKHNFGFEK